METSSCVPSFLLLGPSYSTSVLACQRWCSHIPNCFGQVLPIKITLRIYETRKLCSMSPSTLGAAGFQTATFNPPPPPPLPHHRNLLRIVFSATPCVMHLLAKRTRHLFFPQFLYLICERLLGVGRRIHNQRHNQILR